LAIHIGAVVMGFCVGNIAIDITKVIGNTVFGSDLVIFAQRKYPVCQRSWRTDKDTVIVDGIGMVAT
jgi:hypothetical protein